MNKKTRKQKQKAAVRKSLQNTGYANYQSYLIKECYNSFGTIYYTIINKKLRGHVHSSSLNVAYAICETSHKLAQGYNGRHLKVNYSILLRAEKLLLRKVI